MRPACLGAILLLNRVLLECGSSDDARVSTEAFLASDGTDLSRIMWYDFRSKQGPNKHFRSEVRDVKEVLYKLPHYDYLGNTVGERVVARANNDTILMITRTETEIIVVKGPTIRHVIEFSDQQEALERSTYLTKLIP
jgi:hypothetical protein